VFFYEDILALNPMDYGSFITIPNPLRQFPVKNLIIPEASLKLIYKKELKSN
jgi:hypothetical protein